MPPKPKKRNVLSRFASLFNRDGSESRTQGSASAGIPPSHPSTRSDPELPLPVSDSTLQNHGFPPPIHQSRSEGDGIATSSQSTPLSSMPGYQDDLLRTPQHPRDGNSAGTQGRTTSFFSGASGFRTGDIQYFEASNMTVNTGGEKSVDGWELLLKNIAPNALHDSSARYDAPKCDEDTRVEVTGEIMDWIQDRKPAQRLLCMTGAAGAGKSALQQTIAERCTKSDDLLASFFFSSADHTRNTASHVVATIAYQIGLKHSLIQSAIVAAVKHDPLIFSRSLKSQMEDLIVRPFENLRRSNQLNIDTFPCAILIDGLDECSGNPSSISDPTDDRREAEGRQAELLAAIKHCFLDNDLPFRVFIASRPEWAIRTALETGGYLHQVAYQIRLSDEYDASGDMRRYLQRRFNAIVVRNGKSRWFTEDDIEALVEAASGQFVYVATVFKYISERRGSPAERLKAVLGWTPQTGPKTRPFEALDRLYAQILLNAKNAYEAVDTHDGRDFLLLLRTYHINAKELLQPEMPIPLYFQLPANSLSALLGLEAGAEDNLFSDLQSLMILEDSSKRGEVGDLRLRLYHKSFSDFFEEESRAKDLFVPYLHVYTHLTKCCMHHIIESPTFFDPLPDAWDEPSLPKPYSFSLEVAVYQLPTFLCLTTAIGDEVADFTKKDGWAKLDKHEVDFLRIHWSNWIYCLRRFAEKNVTDQKPDVVVVISEFVQKWESDLNEWGMHGESSDTDSCGSDWQ
ncbi:hypothetical protein EST38_g8474 [Candolleomyces aberdarensis]|uniref:Nephrocystin 3-like N-terminal domain-containing protein n=1 Tax=Candolleomyces aberdarensis TaxID=2316362 RepID=A0A4Q2DFA3_9AGAR|nr:hypothetical protein EST38_g8474 [Candolleomyces aberdarensis]